MFRRFLPGTSHRLRTTFGKQGCCPIPLLLCLRFGCMISIRKLDVPEYLRVSPHYHNSFQDCGNDSSSDDLAIDIPADCLKTNTDVQSVDDLRSLLQTVRFWLVPELIEDNVGLFEFASSHVVGFQQIADEYGPDFPFLVKLSTALQPKGNLTVMGGAVQLGLLGLIKFCVSKGESWETGAGAHFTALAAKHGLLNCLQYATEHGCHPTLDACLAAASGGHLGCLKYVHEQGAPLNAKVLEASVSAGHSVCVQYIIARNVINIKDMNCSCKLAARAGHKEILEYLLDAGCEASIHAAYAAAAYDHLDCLQLLHSRCCPLCPNTLFTAVHCGSMRCLEFLRSLGCAWGPATLELVQAVQYGSISAARGTYYNTFSDDQLARTFIYAAEHGCPVTAKTMMLAASLECSDFVEYLHAGRGVALGALAFRTAVIEGSVACLRYFMDHGFTVETERLLEAVRCGSLLSVQCLHEHGVPWDESMTSLAQQLNKPVILQYLLSHGCPVAEGVMLHAARQRDAACLKCLHEHGVPITREVVIAARNAVATACLQYALSQGGPYSEDDCIYAASRDHLSTLKCLRKHGAQMTAAVVTAALEEGNLECVNYAVEHATSSADLGPVACAAAATKKSCKRLWKLRKEGIPWDSSTCLAAIRSGTFKCLKYALENGCPAEGCVLQAEAAQYGRVEIMMWLHRKGLAWDARTTAAALQSDSAECLKYAVSNGCPYDVPADALEEAPRCQEYMAKWGFSLVEEARLREQMKDAKIV